MGGLAPGDAITAARFSIVIDGYQIASFSELVGITTEVEPVELLESTEKEVMLKKLPGKRKPPTLTLKRGKNLVECYEAAFGHVDMKGLEARWAEYMATVQ